MRSVLRVQTVLVVLVGVGLTACSDSDPPKTSQGMWLEACQTDAQCDEASEGLSCICGTCTKSCEDDSACSDTPGTSKCYASNTSTTYVLCGGETAARSLCLPQCDPEVADSCAAGQACIQAACMTLASLPTELACGSQSCQIETQYCYSQSGGASADNSLRECRPIPSECAATPTCECLQNAGEEFSDCSEEWPGALSARTDLPSTGF